MWEYVDDSAGKDCVSGVESGHLTGVSSFLLCCPPHDSLQCLLLPLHIFWVEDMAWWHRPLTRASVSIARGVVRVVGIEQVRAFGLQGGKYPVSKSS